jgi:hypothetical protein
MCVSVSAGLLCQAVLHGQPQVAAPMGFQPVQSLSVGRARATSAMPVPRPDKGKPFSATVTTQTTQTLSDGTRIVRSTTMLEYRDAEGRVRTETAQSTGQSSEPARAIVISDPVAAVVWRLDPVQRSAWKSVMRPAPEGVFEARAKDALSALVATGVRRGDTEDLGTSNINGILARGTRVTNVVPAGAIGNDREFRSVEERWFSSELNLLIKSVNTDPRFGTTTYELTNISRQVPDHSFFQIPPGYKLTSSDVIEGFEFAGRNRVSEDSLRALLSIRVGDEYNAEAVNRDVAALRNTGRFIDVRANQVRGVHGGVVLRFTLTERP